MKAIDTCKTLQDFKDLVALRKQYVDFTDCMDWVKQSRHIQVITDEATKLYVKYKVKEALKLAAERAEPYSEIISESILSLESELKNQINKEF